MKLLCVSYFELYKNVTLLFVHRAFVTSTVFILGRVKTGSGSDTWFAADEEAGRTFRFSTSLNVASGSTLSNSRMDQGLVCSNQGVAPVWKKELKGTALS